MHLRPAALMTHHPAVREHAFLLHVCMDHHPEKLNIIMTVILLTLKLSASDPEIIEINKGCSQYNVTNFSDFKANLNATFDKLRQQLNSGKYFATVEQPMGSDSAYTMV